MRGTGTTQRTVRAPADAGAVDGPAAGRGPRPAGPLQVVTVGTPVGPFTALGGPGGVLASGFTADPADLRRLLPSPLRDADVRAATEAIVKQALTAYLDGDLGALDGVPVAAVGSSFQQRAWAALRAVPPGDPVTYAGLAARAGSPRAARATGSACARNPTALVVPCHRVVRADGSAGGYAWGPDVKRWLLDHEQRHA